MLKFLRKKENIKMVMWVLAILIIPAFVLWGSGSAIRSKRIPKYAGKIFGKKVSFQEYRESLLACRNQALLIYGDNFNRVIKLLDLEKEAWERLILLYLAKKEKIKVTDEQVIDFIENIALFQKEGRFDEQRYTTLLNYAFATRPREFEEQIRQMFIIDKLRNKFIGKVELTDEEIEKAYQYENEKAKTLYLLVESEKFKDRVLPAYAQLQEYYQNNKSEFQKPEQVNVQYIALYLEENPADVEVNEQEIEKYYTENIAQFSTKDKKGKEGRKPLEEVKTEIKKKITKEKNRIILEERIWQISDEITEEPDSFKDVAENYKLQIKETGFFGPQELIPEIGLSYEFLNAAFTLEKGQVSNFIETPKGYFIIKIKEKKKSYIPDLEEIKEEVKAAAIKQESWKLAKKEADQILSQVKKVMQEDKINFTKAAEKSSLEIKETEQFSRFSYIPGIGQSREFTQAAFELEPGQVSEVIAVANGYCILSLLKIFPFDQERFKQEKEDFSQELLKKKRALYYKVWLNKLKKQANLESYVEQSQEKRTF